MGIVVGSVQRVQNTVGPPNSEHFLKAVCVCVQNGVGPPISEHFLKALCVCVCSERCWPT